VDFASKRKMLCVTHGKETEMSLSESCNEHEDVDDFYKNLKEAGTVQREMMTIFDQLCRRVALLGTELAKTHARESLSADSSQEEFRRSFDTLVDFFTVFNRKELDNKKSKEILMAAAMNGALDVFHKESLRVMKGALPTL
jgi:hypothetical protein